MLLGGIVSCNNDDDCPKSGTAGAGGAVKLSGFVRHHEQEIANARVFIKYGATEFPGDDTTAYDAAVSADGGAYYEFSGLNAGDYYLFAAGFDSTISLPVDGGVPVEICDGAQSVQRNIPVTEDH